MLCHNVLNKCEAFCFAVLCFSYVKKKMPWGYIIEYYRLQWCWETWPILSNTPVTFEENPLCFQSSSHCSPPLIPHPSCPPSIEATKWVKTKIFSLSPNRFLLWWNIWNKDHCPEYIPSTAKGLTSAPFTWEPQFSSGEDHRPYFPPSYSSLQDWAGR